MGAPVQLTAEQFQQLLQAAGAGGARANVGPAMAVGQLAPCGLGRDNTKRYKKFIDWIKKAVLDGNLVPSEFIVKIVKLEISSGFKS